MSREYRIHEYLKYMQIGCSDAISFVDGLTRDDFLSDVKTQRAVVMSLMIVGEASSKLLADFPEFTQQHPNIPWVSMRGMRNRIAHGYFEIDVGVVWQTVNELPRLVNAIEELT